MEPQPAQAVPNVTTHPSTASVPTSYYSMWHYNCLRSLRLKAPRINVNRCTVATGV